MIEDDPARLVRSYDAADIEAALRAGEDGDRRSPATSSLRLSSKHSTDAP